MFFRKPLRWAGWDYASNGAYFVTICAYQREMLFENQTVAQVIRDSWRAIPQHFPSVDVDAFVVMPNHIHGVLILSSLNPVVGPQHAGVLRPDAPLRPSLSVIVRSFKAAATRDLRIRGLITDSKVWQRNFFDRVVRNEAELTRIREYVAANPLLWRYDHENPARNAEPAYDDAWSWLEQP